MKRVLSFLTFLCVAALPLQADTLWLDARTAYDQGQYQEALTAYRNLKEEGTSAALEFNLGNTLMRMGEPVRALAHYRRAQWLSPTDPDIRANLEYAVKETGARVPSLPPLRQATGFLSATIWQTTFITACWLLAAAGIFCRFSGKLRSSGPWLFPALLLVVCVTGLGVFGSRPGPLLHEAVLKEGPVSARFEPLDDATEHFSLPEGSVVTLTAERRDWVRIDTGEQSGWIPAQHIIPLRTL